MNKKILVGVIAIIIAAVGIFTFSNLGNGSKITFDIPVDEKGEVRPLIIVTDPYEPYVYLNEDEEAVGITVDIADSIFTKLGVPFEVRVIPWLRAVEELKNGEADVVSPAGYTAERAEFLYYTQEEVEYTEGPLPLSSIIGSDVVFFARAKFKKSFPLETFESFEEIRDADIRVGAIAGWRSTKRLQDAGVDVIEYIDIPSQFQALVDGLVDIALQDSAVGAFALKKIELGEEIVLLDKAFFVDPMYLSFSKESDYPNLLEIREQYLDEMRKMRDSEEYKEIYKKYTE